MEGTAAGKTKGRFKLKEAVIRLAGGRSLYSDRPLSTPGDALTVMRQEMAQFDREVLCVVNLNTKLQPINFNIVSIGDINTSVVAIPNILKTGLMSNAGSFILLHNHPSGDVTPSREDIKTTGRVIEAGKLMGIPCIDHIIIGGGSGNYCSMREANLADFTNNSINMTAEEILRAAEEPPVYEGEKKTMAEERYGNTGWNPEGYQGNEGVKREEITIKFGRGLAEEFKSKDGRDLVRIMIPNRDPGDKKPWDSFVLPAKAVHENQYGKGLWAKIPADGTTVVSSAYLKGQDDKGKNVWESITNKVPNRVLKEMVEAYKSKAKGKAMER